MSQQNQFINRVATKSVLVKHGADMTRVRITCTATNLYLDGQLHKEGPGNFTPMKVGAMLKELQQRVKDVVVNCNFDNWNVERTAGGFIINKKRIQINYTGGQSNKIYHLSEDDLMKDMLKEIEKEKS